MLKFTLISVFTAALLMWGRLLFKRTNPKRLSESGGVIQLARWIGWAVVLFGGAVIVAVMYGYCSGELTWEMTFGLGLFGAALVGFIAPSLTSRHDVVWDAKGLAGPSRLMGPSLGLRRVAIGWGEIAQTGKTFTDYWYVEAHNGERVYWSYLYGGYGALTAAIKMHRPDLTLPIDL